MSTFKEKHARVVACCVQDKITFKEGIKVEEDAPQTPDSNQPRRTTITQQTSILDMPDDVLYLLLAHIITNLSLNDLLSLSSTCHRLFNLIFNHSNSTAADWNNLWQTIFSKRWPISSIQHQAAILAGSWKCLYKEKHTVEIANQHGCGPFWSKASPLEIEAFVHSFFHHTSTSTNSSSITPAAESPPHTNTVASPLSSASRFTINANTSITFLVDGSGSVTLEDFRHIQDFIITTHNIIHSQFATNNNNKVYMSVVQFSSDYRIELSPKEISPLHCHHHDGIEEEVGKMRRMNGGTHVGAAMRGAHQVIRSLSGGQSDGGDRNNGPSSTAAAAATAAAATAAAAAAATAATAAADEHPLSPLSNTLIIPRKLLVLITDGRIDSFQLQEATDMIQRMREEEERGGGGGGGEIVVKVVGVGRGVDERAMLTIIGGEGPEDNYLGLCTLDELTW